MADRTHIEWTDATWNPVTGCTKISDGCTHCYIDRTPPFRMAGRRFLAPRGISTPDGIGTSTGVDVHPDRIDKPLRWREPRRVFVCSLADLFHAQVPDQHIAHVFASMALAPHHTFQLLTKRPARMRALLSSAAFTAKVADAAYRIAMWEDRYVTAAAARDAALKAYRNWPELPTAVVARTMPWPLPNVHGGTSVESQAWASRLDALMETPLAVRWVSAEPLLGPLILGPWLERVEPQPRLDWVVAGGESGPGSRPMHPAWARSLRDQCTAAGVPFLFKQWGDWTDTEHGLNAVGDDAPIFRRTVGNSAVNGHRMRLLNGTTMVRLGKGNAGRLLDGRTHDAYPDQPQLAAGDG